MSRCVNNMRQIGTGVLMYSEDNGGAFPRNRFDKRPATRTWKHAVAKYVRSMDVYICPSNIGYFSPLPGATPMDESGEFPRSYAYNGCIFHKGAALPEEQLRKLSDIRMPTRTIYILESRSEFPDLGCWSLVYDKSQGFLAGYYSEGKGRIQTHTGRLSNWLMCDMHVSSMSVAQTCVPNNMWGSYIYPPGSVPWSSQA